MTFTAQLIGSKTNTSRSESPWAKTADFKSHTSKVVLRQLRSCCWNKSKCKWIHFSSIIDIFGPLKWPTNFKSYGSTNQQHQQRMFITLITVNISLSLSSTTSCSVRCFVKHSLRLCVTELLCLIKIKAESVCAHWELEQQKDPLQNQHQSALYTHSCCSLQLNEKFKLPDIHWDNLQEQRNRPCIFAVLHLMLKESVVTKPWSPLLWIS